MACAFPEGSVFPLLVAILMYRDTDVVKKMILRPPRRTRKVILDAANKCDELSGTSAPYLRQASNHKLGLIEKDEQSTSKLLNLKSCRFVPETQKYRPNLRRPN